MVKLDIGRSRVLDLVDAFIEPGSPWENGFIESFNGRLRAECLYENWFLSLQDARDKVEAWRLDYNHVRPHSALGNLAPENSRNQASTNRPGKSSIFSSTMVQKTGAGQIHVGSNLGSGTIRGGRSMTESKFSTVALTAIALLNLRVLFRISQSKDQVVQNKTDSPSFFDRAMASSSWCVRAPSMWPPTVLPQRPPRQ